MEELCAQHTPGRPRRRVRQDIRAVALRSLDGLRRGQAAGRRGDMHTVRAGARQSERSVRQRRCWASRRFPHSRRTTPGWSRSTPGSFSSLASCFAHDLTQVLAARGLLPRVADGTTGPRRSPRRAQRMRSRGLKARGNPVDRGSSSFLPLILARPGILRDSKVLPTLSVCGGRPCHNGWMSRRWRDIHPRFAATELPLSLSAFRAGRCSGPRPYSRSRTGRWGRHPGDSGRSPRDASPMRPYARSGAEPTASCGGGGDDLVAREALHESPVPYDGGDLSEQAAVMAINLLAQHPLDLLLFLRVASDRDGATEGPAFPGRGDGSSRQVDGSGDAVAGLRPPRAGDCSVRRTAWRRLDRHVDPRRSDLVRMLVGSVTRPRDPTLAGAALVLHPPTMSIDRVSPRLAKAQDPAARRLGVRRGSGQMAVSLLSPERTELSLVRGGHAADAEADRARNPGRSSYPPGAAGARHDDDDPGRRDGYQINALAIEGGHDLIVMSTHWARGWIDARRKRHRPDGSHLRSTALVIQPHSMETPFDPGQRRGRRPKKAAHRCLPRPDLHLHVVRAQAAVRVRPEAYIGRRLDRPVGFPSAGEGMAQEGDGPPVAREVRRPGETNPGTAIDSVALPTMLRRAWRQCRSLAACRDHDICPW